MKSQSVWSQHLPVCTTQSVECTALSCTCHIVRSNVASTTSLLPARLQTRLGLTMSSTLQCCDQCLSHISRNGHHPDHPKPLSTAQWHQCQHRSPNCCAQVSRAHVGRVHVRVYHIEPETAFSRALTRPRVSRIHVFDSSHSRPLRRSPDRR